MRVTNTGGWKWELSQSWACPELSERQVKGNARQGQICCANAFLLFVCVSKEAVQSWEIQMPPELVVKSL